MINLLYLVMPMLLLPPTAAVPTANKYLLDTGEKKPRYYLLLMRLRPQSETGTSGWTFNVLSSARGI